MPRPIPANAIAERCQRLKHLLDVLKGAPRVEKAGFSYPVVDEDRYPSEIAAITAILDDLALSPALHDFFSRKTADLARAVTGAYPPATLRAAWEANTSQPGGDLQVLITRQCALFSDKGLLFTPNPLHILPLSWTIRGSFNAASGALAVTDNIQALEDRTLPPIILNQTVLAKDDVLGVQEAAFHEQMHGILWQLGLAAYHGDIPEDHPFYNDAVSICERIKNGVEYMPHYIPGAYDADPLEKTCLRYEALYVQQCRVGPGLSNTVKTLWNRIFS